MSLILFLKGNVITNIHLSFGSYFFILKWTWRSIKGTNNSLNMQIEFSDFICNLMRSFLGEMKKIVPEVLTFHIHLSRSLFLYSYQK